MINNVIDAERLANKYFKDKVDKGGNPYIEHLRYVAYSCDNENSQIVGMLHDIIEDTDISISELESELYENLIESIQRLSKPKNIRYNTYINNICESNDIIAIEVKMHDLEHNMDLSRLKEIRQVDEDRIKKYKKAYDKIKTKYEILKHNEYRNNLILKILKYINNPNADKEYLYSLNNERLENVLETLYFNKSHSC